MFEPLFGHSEILARFLHSLKTATTAHAWLLHGPSGIGKSLLLHRLAATFLCATQSACGGCSSCKQLSVGSHPDVFLLRRPPADAEGKLKRDISIEDTRSALTFLSRSGMQGARRVLLIEEAELLNRNGANALLKSLEEPSSDALILLGCSNLPALPITILSRCLLCPVAPLTESECRQVVRNWQLPPAIEDLALRLASGRPGKVAVLSQSASKKGSKDKKEKTIGEALLDWLALFNDPARCDLAAVESWGRSYAATVPPTLIAETLLLVIEPALTRSSSYRSADFSAHKALLDAADELASWPERLRRQTLRPAPSLLALVIGLRLALAEAKGN